MKSEAVQKEQLSHPNVSIGQPAFGLAGCLGVHPLRETVRLSIKVEHFLRGDVSYARFTQKVFQRVEIKSCSSL